MTGAMDDRRLTRARYSPTRAGRSDFMGVGSR